MTNDECISDAERELLLEQYNVLREEIRTSIQQHNRRVLSGIAGIGAVAGYALLRESRWLFAIIPFIIGVMFIQTVNNNRFIASNASHQIDIEAKLSEVTPLFCWETKYGGFFGNEPAALRESPHLWLSWDIFLKYGMFFIAIATYVFATVVGYIFWPTRPEGLGFLDQLGILMIYCLFTLFGTFIGVLGWWHMQEVSPSAESPSNWLKSKFG